MKLKTINALFVGVLLAALTGICIAGGWQTTPPNPSTLSAAGRTAVIRGSLDVFSNGMAGGTYGITNNAGYTQVGTAANVLTGTIATVGITNTSAAITNTRSYTQSGSQANTFTGATATAGITDSVGITANAGITYGASATVTSNATGPTILGVPWTVMTTASFSSGASNTTLAEVSPASGPVLGCTLVAGHTYRYEFGLLTTCNASGGAKFALGGAVTPGVFQGVFYTSNATTCVASNTLTTGTGATAAVTNCAGSGCISVPSADGGTFFVQFAQNASFGTASTVNAGSFFTVTMIQ